MAKVKADQDAVTHNVQHSHTNIMQMIEEMKKGEVLWERMATEGEAMARTLEELCNKI